MKGFTVAETDFARCPFESADLKRRELATIKGYPQLRVLPDEVSASGSGRPVDERRFP